MKRRGWILMALVLGPLLAWPADRVRAGSRSLEDQLLDAVYRIDIQTIRGTLTFDPAALTVAGSIDLVFRMRPGQTRPIIHFDPLNRGALADYDVALDGQPIEGFGPAGLKLFTLPGTTQPSVEISRDITDAGDHLLTVNYRLPLDLTYPRFASNVNDIYGRGNEEVWPTINAPGELARHQLIFRVVGSVPYRFIGSGLVQKSARTDLQEWTLDTEREVASYTVMFALLPQADTVYEERIVNGTPVRIMAFAGGASLAQAWTQITPWLPDLAAKFGPFPMPRGLSILLVREGGGMEYFGGTISSVSALKHEINHMYFGCSTIAKTYRDSWWDEAVTSWYVDYAQNMNPLPSGFKSNLVNARSPYAVGFDTRAYYEGAEAFEAMARAVGGKQPFLLFLADLRARHTFEPFTTLQLADYFREFSGVDMRPDFINWFYQGKTPFSAESSAAAQAAARMKEIDWTPPEPIAARYPASPARRNP
jgi:hypothetical protein